MILDWRILRLTMRLISTVLETIHFTFVAFVLYVLFVLFVAYVPCRASDSGIRFQSIAL